MPTRKVPRLIISSRREGAGCCAWAERFASNATARAARIRTIISSPPLRELSLYSSPRGGFRPDASRWRGRVDRVERNLDVTISMYEASVGLFVPQLRNLSGLLDKGVAYAEARKFNPA